MLTAGWGGGGGPPQPLLLDTPMQSGAAPQGRVSTHRVHQRDKPKAAERSPCPHGVAPWLEPGPEEKQKV